MLDAAFRIEKRRPSPKPLAFRSEFCILNSELLFPVYEQLFAIIFTDCTASVGISLARERSGVLDAPASGEAIGGAAAGASVPMICTLWLTCAARSAPGDGINAYDCAVPPSAFLNMNGVLLIESRAPVRLD